MRLTHGTVSVLAPVGSALLGLSVGQSIDMAVARRANHDPAGAGGNLPAGSHPQTAGVIRPLPGQPDTLARAGPLQGHSRPTAFSKTRIGQPLHQRGAVDMRLHEPPQGLFELLAGRMPPVGFRQIHDRARCTSS